MNTQRKPGEPSLAETVAIGYVAPVAVSLAAILTWGYSLTAVAVCLVAGLTAPVYWMLKASKAASSKAGPSAAPSSVSAEAHATLVRLTAIIFFTAAVSSLVFQSTTFALPQVFKERLGGIEIGRAHV